jgi:hypothetical protein
MAGRAGLAMSPKERERTKRLERRCVPLGSQGSILTRTRLPDAPAQAAPDMLDRSDRGRNLLRAGAIAQADGDIPRRREPQLPFRPFSTGQSVSIWGSSYTQRPARFPAPYVQEAHTIRRIVIRIVIEQRANERT